MRQRNTAIGSIRCLLPGLSLSLLLTVVPARAQSSVCYAKSGGSDSNDGSYWAFAKADVMACYDALPSRGGTIYIMDGGRDGGGIPACKPSDPHGCGIWIMGQIDPNYPHPPDGWRRAKAAVSFVGVGGTHLSFNSYQGQVFVSAGDGNDIYHPGIWLSGVGSSLHFENLAIQYPGRGIVVGENSNFDRTRAGRGGSQGVSFENVSAAVNSKIGNGPTVDLTGGSFWLRFIRCGFSANTRAPSPTDDKGAAVLLDGKYGAGASAYFEDTSIAGGGTGGGGIKFYTNTYTITSLYIHGLQTESLQNVPAVWLLPSVPGGSATGMASITISDVSLADSVGPTPAVRVDGLNNPPENVLVTGLQDGMVVGAATVFSQSPPGLYSTTVPSPLSLGQRGIFRGRVVGQTDAARRGFSPVVARFPNLASQSPSKWWTSGKAQISDVPAPDGTKNATRVASLGGLSYAQFFVDRNYQPGIGDRILAGVWVRAATANGYYGGNPVQLICDACSLAGPGQSGKTSNYAVLQAPWKGDGEWEWLWGAWQVTASPRKGAIMLSGYADPRTATDFFAPVLLEIPAGAISDNEAWELAINLQSYRDGALPGQVSLLRGEQFKADSIQVGDGPSITSGLGPPKGSATAGSIYLRRDGEPGSTFYIYEKSGWKAQF